MHRFCFLPPKYTLSSKGKGKGEEMSKHSIHVGELERQWIQMIFKKHSNVRVHLDKSSDGYNMEFLINRLQA